MGGRPESHGQALEQLVDALIAVHTVDWRKLRSRRPRPPSGDRYLARQVDRVAAPAGLLREPRPPGRRRVPKCSDSRARRTSRSRSATATTSSTTRCSRPERRGSSGRRLGDGGHRQSLVDLAWAFIFTPDRRARCDWARLADVRGRAPADHDQLVERYAAASGRDVSQLGWYDVFSRWKLAVVLEGSNAKFLQGRSTSRSTELFPAPRWISCSTRATELVAGGVLLMRAWQVQDAGRPVDVLHEVELDPPEPGPGQVRIRDGRTRHRAAGRPHVPRHVPVTPPRPFTPGRRPPGWSSVGAGVDLVVGTASWR